jgi:hypothetical protein
MRNMQPKILTMLPKGSWILHGPHSSFVLRPAIGTLTRPSEYVLYGFMAPVRRRQSRRLFPMRYDVYKHPIDKDTTPLKATVEPSIISDKRQGIEVLESTLMNSVLVNSEEF